MTRRNILAAGAFGLVFGLMALSFLVGGRWKSQVTFEPGSFSGRDGETIIMGSKYFYVPAGGRLELDYEVKLARGVFQLRVLPWAMREGRAKPGLLEVVESGRGRFEATFEEGGVYWLAPGGASAGRTGPRGYDARFDLKWRVRW